MKPDSISTLLSGHALRWSKIHFMNKRKSRLTRNLLSANISEIYQAAYMIWRAYNTYIGNQCGKFRKRRASSPVRLAHASFAREEMLWFLLLNSAITFPCFSNQYKGLLVPLLLEGGKLGCILAPDSTLDPRHRALLGIRINPVQPRSLGFGTRGD